MYDHDPIRPAANYVEVRPIPWYKSESLLFQIAVTVIGIVIAFVPLVTQQAQVLGLDDRAVTVLGLIASLLGLIGGALRLTVTRPIGSEDGARAVKAPKV